MEDRISIAWEPFVSLTVNLAGLQFRNNHLSSTWQILDPKTGGKLDSYDFTKIQNYLDSLSPRQEETEKFNKITDFLYGRNQLLLRANSKLSRWSPSQIIGGITLSPSGSCSGGCTYCYARNRFTKAKISQQTPFEIVRQTFEFIRTNPIICNPCGITLGGGGDPTENFNLYLKVIQLSKIYHKKYGITIPIYIATLDPIFLQDYMIEVILENQDWITLSIDGDPKLPYHRQKTDFAHFIKQYGKRCKWAASAVFTSRTAPLIKHNYEFLIDSGFDAVQMRPVRLPANHPLSLKPKDFEVAILQYEEMIQSCTQNAGIVEFVNKLTTADALGRYYLLYLTESGVDCRCASGGGAGFGTVFVDSKGQLYPCPSVTFETMRLGNVYTGDIDFDVLYKLHKNPEECRQCQILNVCGGPCLYESILTTGKPDRMNAPACRFEQDAAYMVKNSLTALYTTRPDFLSVLVSTFVTKVLGL